MKDIGTHIDNLLGKYWDGVSSLSEEKELKSYFNSEEIEKKHQQYSPLFNFFEKEAEVRFEGKLEAKEVPLRKVAMKYMRVAAMVLFLIIAGVLLYQNYSFDSPQANDQWSKYEVEDPEEAREKAMEALVFLSAKFQKGENNVKENFKVLNKIPIK